MILQRDRKYTGENIKLLIISRFLGNLVSLLLQFASQNLPKVSMYAIRLPYLCIIKLIACMNLDTGGEIDQT